MRKKNGFTMIELLAIIVILAIIALIAIPVVLNIIDKVRVASYARSADNILDATRIYFKETQIDSTMSIEGNNYDNVMENIGGRKPDSGEIYIKKNGDIALALKYSKYCYKKGYSDNTITQTELEECNLSVELDENAPIITAKEESVTIEVGTSKEITSYFTIDANGASGIKETVCKNGDDIITNTSTLTSGTYTIICTVTKNNGKSASANINIVSSLPSLIIGGQEVSVVTLGDGLYLDSDGVYRYKGATPDNYIMLGEEEYRIMAIEDQGIKVIRSEVVTTSFWNGGNNTWEGSIAKNYLYNTYYNNLNSVQHYIVEGASWNIGSVTYTSTIELDTVKSEEISTTWEGKIGLITYSDYIQAQAPSSSGYSNCSSNVYYNSNCEVDNWLKPSNVNIWTISSCSNDSYGAWSVSNGFGISISRVNDSMSGLLPVVYLSPDITLSGSGTQGEGAFTIVESQ